MIPGERELIEKFQSGKTEVFDDIMKLLQTNAVSLAYRWTGNREDAFDIAQEAFIRMWRILPAWKAKASLSTWLYRVITNLSIDQLRRRNRLKEVNLEAVTPPPEKNGKSHPRKALLGKEAGERIKTAVADLPERQKAVFILRHYQGLSLREIAIVQKCSLGAVKANLFQALKKLQKKLKVYYHHEGEK